MRDDELHSLFHHPKIKAFVSLTHGEGFGLPLFEAAYSGMPVLAPDWSGHLDFLYMPVGIKHIHQVLGRVDHILYLMLLVFHVECQRDCDEGAKKK